MAEGRAQRAEGNGPGGDGASPSTVHHPPSTDPWTVAGLTLHSRVLLGTSRYPSLQVLLDCLDASGAELVTVAVRRMDLGDVGEEESLLGALRARGVRFLPNTAG